MDARKFWTMCRLHDWFYMMSDDPNEQRDGEDSMENIERIMRDRPDLYEIYDAWRAHVYEAGPKPKEPRMED